MTDTRTVQASLALCLGLAAGSCTSVADQAIPGSDLAVPLGLFHPPSRPAGEFTSAMVVLGRDLFFDSRLSRDSALSCASCHSPLHAFTEPRPVSHGIGIGARKRNTPSVLNAVFAQTLDWDGRARTLEEQVLGVYSPTGDAGISVEDALAILQADTRYNRLFLAAFERTPDVRGFASALAAFQRTLLSGDSRFDRFFLGGDSTALTLAERRGWELFRSSKAGCMGCHTAIVHDARGGLNVLFTNQAFKNLGVGYKNGKMSDLGRYEITRRRQDWGAFKTPSLRNVALTAPYMHDGSLATLEEVIEFYADGGIPNPNLDATIAVRPFSKQERADLVAFLRSLTSERLRDTAALRAAWTPFLGR